MSCIIGAASAAEFRRHVAAICASIRGHCHLEDASIRDQPEALFAAATESMASPEETDAAAALCIQNSAFKAWANVDRTKVVRKAFRGISGAIDAVKPLGIFFMQLAVRLACAAARSSAANVTAEMNRCFEEVGALFVKGDDFTTSFAGFRPFDPNPLPEQSLTAVLSSCLSVLSNARMESDRTAEEKSRVCGSLLVMAMSFAAAESIPQVWIHTGGWNTIARLLRDENVSRTVVELALTAVTSLLKAHFSEDHIAAIVGAGFSSVCVSSLSRFRDHPRIRLTAATLLGSLCCSANAESLRRLISDGAVLALVQLLQQRCDGNNFTHNLNHALRHVATLPEGRAALHHRDVWRAFNIAFQQHSNWTT